MNTRIVIDVGCARHGGDYSIERLIDAYHPELLVGFDPAPNFQDAMPEERHGTTVVLYAEAAWTFDGEVMFSGEGLVAHVGGPARQQERGTQRMVPCVDLARVIMDLGEGDLVVKFDCEGGEFDLLEHLIATGADKRCERILVEWHPVGEGERRHRIETTIGCQLEQWRW